MMTHFHKVGDRKIGQVVLSMKVNPKLDIIALKLATGDIILHRLISWQRVWTAPKLKNLKANEIEKSEDGKEHVKIADYEWSPDGKILAIVYAGFIEGDKQSYPLNLVSSFRHVQEGKECPSCVVLFDIDANKMLSFINSDLCIRSLCWRNQKKIAGNVGLPLDCLDIPYLDLFADEDEFYQFLGPQVTFKVQNLGMVNSSSSKGSKKSSHRNGYNLKNTIEGYEKVSLYGSTPDSVPFNMLLTGSEDNKIDFYAFGLYRLIRIDLNHLTPDSFPSQNITQLWISNDLAIVNAITVPSISDSVTDLSILPICLLRKKWRELHAFVRIKSQIDVRLEYLFDSLKEINSIWEDLMAEIDSKLSNYVQRDEEPVDANPFKQRSKKILLQPDEFIEMLVFGEISLNLEKFLTELTEKTLKKLSSTIEVSFLDIHKTNINKVQRALFHILSLANVLKGMSLHDLQFGDLCLSTQLINSFIRETHSMLQKTVQLQSNLNDSMRKTKAFIRWLYKCTLMVVNNDPNSSFNGENGESEFSTGNVLTNQDLNLIMNFLRENSLTNGFKFENVAAFLQKGKAKQTVVFNDLKATTWENDLFDDGDSINEAANEQPCSLYEHLYRMYEQFEFIFSEEHPSAKKMNDLVKAELEVTKAKMVEQIGLRPHAIDYICGSNGEDDFMVALMGELADSFDLYSFTKSKDGEKKTVNKRMVEFTVQEESTMMKLAVDDVKFYNEEFLTVVLTSDLKRDDFQELKKDVAEPSSTQEDMSLMSDEEMISEEESGSFSVLSKKTTTPSKSTALQTGHQFLVQLAYRQLWEKIEYFPGVLSIDVTAEVVRLRPKGDADELEMEVDETERQPVQPPKEHHSPGDSSPGTEAKSDSNSPEETYEDLLSTLKKSSSELIFMRYLGEGPVSSRLAVSGTRKVACLATSAGSRVAVYEMDNDEEEEEQQQEDDMSAENNSNGEDDHPKSDAEAEQMLSYSV